MFGGNDHRQYYVSHVCPNEKQIWKRVSGRGKQRGTRESYSQVTSTACIQLKDYNSLSYSRSWYDSKSFVAINEFLVRLVHLTFGPQHRGIIGRVVLCRYYIWNEDA